MKEPERLVRKYYADHGITHGSTLLFSYIRKDQYGGDGCIVEYYAAKYGHVRGKKGKDVVTKLVMKFYPDTGLCSMTNSVIRCAGWSCMYIDHLNFDFHKEMSGVRDYSKCHGCEGAGGNELSSRRKWRGEIMPTSEIPLNDFSGTRYAYCKYAFKPEEWVNGNKRSFGYWAKNPYGNLPDYLRLFDLNPRAMEMFAARGLVKFMKKNFLLRIRDDKPFAKWYKKHAMMTVGRTIGQIYSMARKDIGKTCWEIVRNEDRRLARLAKKRRIVRMNRAEERRRKKMEELERNERETRKKRIRDLYCQLKSVCRMFGAYEVIVPKSEAEMKREGKRMHNCIGEYYPKHQGISSICVFLHRNGKPCVDVEIDAFDFHIVQCRAVCNGQAEDSAREVAKQVASEIKLIRKAA